MPVNAPGEAPLSRAQAWAGLVRKARDARLFFAPDECTRDEIVEENASYLTREATILGDELTQIIAFEAETKIRFFQAKSPREGAIINELFEDENADLQLRFYCYLGLRGKTPNGPEEQAAQAWMDSDTGFKAAIQSTLKRIRELLDEGEL
ncbi:AtaL-like protein [Lysobacter capsici]|uniref:AtaL-like protein n=1 Tax=Lysobacter capsici TaxID=435897 RepID=UPI0018E0539D|nr:AtaL-like protein [Lysobacter capsici]